MVQAGEAGRQCGVGGCVVHAAGIQGLEKADQCRRDAGILSPDPDPQLIHSDQRIADNLVVFPDTWAIKGMEMLRNLDHKQRSLLNRIRTGIKLS